VRVEDLAVLRMTVFLIWVVMLYGPVAGYQRIGETYFLHLQGLRRRQYVSSKLWYPPSSPHSIITEKDNTGEVCGL
jgi:hypothetical protein